MLSGWWRPERHGWLDRRQGAVASDSSDSGLVKSLLEGKVKNAMTPRSAHRADCALWGACKGGALQPRRLERRKVDQ